MSSAVFKLRNLETLQALPVPQGEFLVGRESVCHIVLQHPDTSRIHARLINDGEKLWVRDLGSSNGTYVFENRVSDLVEVNFGDVIGFADEWFRVDPEVIGETHGVEASGPTTLKGVELITVDTAILPRPTIVEKAKVFNVPTMKMPKPRIAGRTSRRIVPKTPLRPRD